jgi:hypothetical protein
LLALGLRPQGSQEARREVGRQGGAHLSLKDIDSMRGQPPDTVNAKDTVQARPWTSEQVGTASQLQSPATTAALQGGARKKRNDLVREIMKTHKLSLPAASKHIKEHKLY